MTGPISGPHTLRPAAWSVRNSVCQNESGTQAPTAPAISRPMTMSRITAAHSITKMWLTESARRR